MQTEKYLSWSREVACASEANKLSMWGKVLDSKFSMWRMSLVHQRRKNDVGSGTLRHEQRKKRCMCACAVDYSWTEII